MRLPSGSLPASTSRLSRRLFARGGDRPSGPGADREAALAAGDARAEKEAALPGAKDIDTEARDLVIIDEHVAVDRRHQGFTDRSVRCCFMPVTER